MQKNATNLKPIKLHVICIGFNFLKINVVHLLGELHICAFGIGQHFHF